MKILAEYSDEYDAVQVDDAAYARAAVDVPLIVDLDGTLCRTDTLHEGVLGMIAKRPGALLSLPGWLLAGKAAFKARVGGHGVVDPELLPYDAHVLECIAAARGAGRTVGLVSAADHRQVSAVAAHLGLFDFAIGTGSPDAPANLRSAAKADLLVARFGAQGFDYIGDSRADLPVWAAARRAFAVGASAGTQRAAKARGLTLEEVGGRRPSTVRALVKAARPHQWAKNMLILLPVLTAHDPSKLPVALVALLCFSLAASAIYILNDLIDLPSDRAHPRKRNRPFAAGSASVVQGLGLSASLLLGSVGIAALTLPLAFLPVLLTYLVATTAYSLWLKRKMMVDVIGLATLYTLRIVAGGVATGIVLSPWLLVFSMFLFFALATIKRQAELEDMATRSKQVSAGRNLILADLPILQALSIAASVAAVQVFALYTQASEVQEQFGSPDLLLLICPVLFLWLGRMQLLTRRGFMTDDPIVFTFRDRISMQCGVMILGVFLLATRGAF